MAKLLSVKDTSWGFYEAMENGSREAMADYFETLMHHYKRRGELQKEVRERFDWWEADRGGYILEQKWRDELRGFLFKGRAPNNTMASWDTIKRIRANEGSTIYDKNPVGKTNTHP